METWLLFLIPFSFFAATILLKFFFFPSANKLPPGPPSFPFIGSSVWFTESLIDINALIRSLHSKFGPIITLYIGSRPAIFVADGFLAHQALVQNGVVFADRPPAVGMEAINSSNQHTISSASYGPTWRLLRRNLTSEIIHPSRFKSYSQSRKRILQILKIRLESESKSGGKVRVIDHFKYATFSLLALICVGDDLEEDQIEKIEAAQRQFVLNYVRFNVFGICPSITKLVFRKMWKQYLQIRENQEKVLIPLIRARKDQQEREIKDRSYVDSLIDLELPEEKRKLTEEEIVSLCSEIFNGGTETTSTALEWIMANLVKYPKIQEKLFMEIKSVVADGDQELIKEDDLQKMPYLKAVILEGLRRHPPAHMVVPHAVKEDTMLDQYLVPKNATVNFMVAEIGRDPRVWEDPMEFKPERFMESEEVFDVSGSKEVKMMPFGVGRRICPGYSLAILHLEYIVGNLIWSYEWKAMEGEEIDLSEQLQFSVAMKHPLQPCLSPRHSLKKII
ncbi:cytochrome P450 89A2-like [Euphorbia lathyris]|uniref:cytochrome P450 89A2-like n=1 Tax=Euphorbia lathyris TaxID=212925 RepID=UPI003313F3A1